ncbi:hypothetical protein AWH67_00145 [Bartonella bacilliformis]|nr:hypothetical protein AWH67_00145 [Bartonella bacilliformis]
MFHEHVICILLAWIFVSTMVRRLKAIVIKVAAGVMFSSSFFYEELLKLHKPSRKLLYIKYSNFV